jgi:hypothetical protein
MTISRSCRSIAVLIFSVPINSVLATASDGASCEAWEPDPGPFRDETRVSSGLCVLQVRDEIHAFWSRQPGDGQRIYHARGATIDELRQAVAEVVMAPLPGTAHANVPCVIHDPDNGSYPWRMWFTSVDGLDSVAARIGYAESADGEAWEFRGFVLEPDGSGFDAFMVGYPWVVKVDGGFILYFTALDVGSDANSGMFSIGMAVSPDGLSWSLGEQVLPAFGPGWDLESPCVVRDDGIFQMWYDARKLDASGREEVKNHIRCASSPDGLTWKDEGIALDAYGFAAGPRLAVVGEARHLTFRFHLSDEARNVLGHAISGSAGPRLELAVLPEEPVRADPGTIVSWTVSVTSGGLPVEGAEVHVEDISADKLWIPGTTDRDGSLAVEVMLPADCPGGDRPIVFGPAWKAGYPESGKVVRTVRAGDPAGWFRRGDADGSGAIDLADPRAVLGYLFLGEGAPGCLDAVDADDSGAIDLADAISSLEWQFLGGPEPPSPGPARCGPDPALDVFPACDDPACR